MLDKLLTHSPNILECMLINMIVPRIQPSMYMTGYMNTIVDVRRLYNFGKIFDETTEMLKMISYETHNIGTFLYKTTALL